jgi:hypothetical protein
MRMPMAWALLALTLASPARAEDFRCRGDDPGWELGGSDSRTVLRAGSGGGRTFTGSATSLPAQGVVVWRGRSPKDAGDLVVVMTEGACSAAAAAGSYTAVVSPPGGPPLVGCCSIGGRAADAPEEEAASLAVGEGAQIRGARGLGSTSATSPARRRARWWPGSPAAAR